MILTNNNYSISVNDDDNNKCSKDCKYYHSDTLLGIICTFDFLECDSKDVVKLKNDNRTEYCKEFFKK